MSIALPPATRCREYLIEANEGSVANISKRWFRIFDTYGVEIAPEQNDAPILMISVAVDPMANPGR